MTRSFSSHTCLRLHPPSPAQLASTLTATGAITAASLTAVTGPNTLNGGTTIQRSSSGFALTVQNTAGSGTIGAITVSRGMSFAACWMPAGVY